MMMMMMMMPLYIRTDWLGAVSWHVKAQDHNSIKLWAAEETRRPSARTGSLDQKLWLFRKTLFNRCFFPSPTDSSAMGVKMLQCFPFYRRCKERCKSRQCPPAAGEESILFKNNKKKVQQWTAISWQRHQIVPDFLSQCHGPHSVPVEEAKPRLCSTTSWSSDSEGGGSLNRNPQIYFSTKARLSFRHQLDSNINAVDATYWGGLRATGRETDSLRSATVHFLTP